MTDFKTPTRSNYLRKLSDNPELQTPIKIPATPFLKQIGYGTGVNVFTLERSPKIGCTRSPWALKKRNRGAAQSKVYNERIRFEAEVLRKLNHPNVVGFRAYTESAKGEPCLAMEKMDKSLGDLLEERIEEGGDPLPAKNILRIAYDVAKALEYLHHTAYILHGDVKSYNVLIAGDCETAKLCDFGVSIPLTESLESDRSKGDFEYVGTRHWCAPEVLSGDGPVTNKADIWSYGLVIWEMIALSPPIISDEESLDESVMEVSILDNSVQSDKENCSPIKQDDISYTDVKADKCGTRPPLPAVDLGPEYEKVLEVFYACTTKHYPIRPSAKDLVEFFKRYVYSEK